MTLKVGHYSEHITSLLGLTSNLELHVQVHKVWTIKNRIWIKFIRYLLGWIKKKVFISINPYKFYKNYLFGSSLSNENLYSLRMENIGVFYGVCLEYYLRMSLILVNKWLLNFFKNISVENFLVPWKFRIFKWFYT